jgi:hypothetical protein
MNLSIDQQIDAAHSAAEQTEAEALQIEARIVRAGGIPPVRQYGKPVSAADIARNMTLTGLINSRDPALASFLGIQTGSHQRRQEEEAARKAAAERMQAQTEALRQQNDQARFQREHAARLGVDPLTGRRRF